MLPEGFKHNRNLIVETKNILKMSDGKNKIIELYVKLIRGANTEEEAIKLADRLLIDINSGKLKAGDEIIFFRTMSQYILTEKKYTIVKYSEFSRNGGTFWIINERNEKKGLSVYAAGYDYKICD